MELLAYDDIFFAICQYLNLKQIVKLEQLSKRHQHLIRNYPWMHITANLNNNTLFVLERYHFKKWNLSETNVDDDMIKKLKDSYFLNLSYCKKITDDGVKELKNCHTLHLHDTNISDVSVQELTKCHTLNLACSKVTDRSVIQLTNCYNLNLTGTYVTNNSVKHLKNCHTLNLYMARNITDDAVKELTNCHTLILNELKITDESVKELTNCHTLWIDCNSKVTKECLEGLKIYGCLKKCYLIKRRAATIH